MTETPPASPSVLEGADSSKGTKSIFTQADDIAKALQSVLAVVIGFGAILTVSGFIIVNTYLSAYTDIQSYSILPAQYLAAGVGLFVLVSIFFCYWILDTASTF